MVLVSAFLHISLYLCVVFVNLARLFLLYQYGKLYDFFGQIYKMFCSFGGFVSFVGCCFFCSVGKDFHYF